MVVVRLIVTLLFISCATCFGQVESFFIDGPVYEFFEHDNTSFMKIDRDHPGRLRVLTEHCGWAFTEVVPAPPEVRVGISKELVKSSRVRVFSVYRCGSRFEQ